VNYIMSVLSETNLVVRSQPFNVTNETTRSHFSQLQPVKLPYKEFVDYRVLTHTGSGDVSAVVHAISGQGCDEEDFENFKFGSVALVIRGGCTFYEKVAVSLSLFLSLSLLSFSLSLSCKCD
jgi:hypothetical protein